MKNLILFISLFPFLVHGQGITGAWHGILKVQGMELRIVFHISNEDSTYNASMDSPDQKAFGITAGATKFENSTLNIDLPQIGVRYQGQYSLNKIDGFFYQSGQSFPLNLTTESIGKKEHFRPQEPTLPYSYISEDVSFPSEGGNIELAGTLTLPHGNKKFATAILITGSGPQNRDEEFMNHKPFLVLADHLTKNGIAVLRYDDRGFGQSTGKHGSATSADFATDVKAAIAFLKTRKEINENQIGLIGHSEGGLIAPIVAVDTEVSFIVLMAAPGVNGSKILLQQTESISRSQGMDEESIKMALGVNRDIFGLFNQFGDDESFETKLRQYLTDLISKNKVLPEGIKEEEFITMQTSQFKRPWMRYFLKYDPVHSLTQIKCPVFALNGEKDVQVAPENLLIIEEALKQGGNQKVHVKKYPNMNHLFQTCKTGSMEEYANIEQTIDPLVLEDITHWVLNQNK